MEAYFVMFGGILLFATIIGILDIIGRRRDRASRHQRTQ